MGTMYASSDAVAASNRARPCSTDSGGTPEAAMRCMSASDSVPVMPLVCAHAPHAKDCAASPCDLRNWASTSRKTLPAA